MSTTFFAPGSRRALARWAGVGLAVLSAIAPLLPLGPLASTPPFPLAALWLAYGMAVNGEGARWRPVAGLFLLGMVQDVVSANPLGLFATLNVFAFLAGGLAANATRAAALSSSWAGFAATAASVGLLAALIGPWAVGPDLKLGSLSLALLVTTALFPLVRPLYGERGLSP